MVQMADRAGREPVSTGATLRLPVETLIGKLPQGSDGLTGITVSADQKEPVAFAFGRERTLYLDPYNGRLLGQSSKGVRAFFASIERWHRALGAELRGHGPWRGIADAANFGFLFLVVSGVYLWIPRVWSAQRLRSIAAFRRNVSGKATLWNIHNVVGIWCAVPLFIVVLSGVIMSYTWANNLLYRISGTEPPVQGGRQAEGLHRNARRHQNSQHSLELGALFERAGEKVSSWRTITLRWDPAAPVDVFTIDQGNGGQPQLRSQLTLDARDGTEKRWEPFASNSTGRRWRAWARFLHTGEAVGLVGQIVAALAAFGGAVLVVTGIGMAWLRLNAARRAKRRESDLLVAAR
jgi:uncharacterized iron-regulated membrane protein